ncbi:MAG: hypothetical protein HYR88_17470 [Verrucomicrobia bacterium]|nr:hypothetical protein [Verrucomicrobiota bacterium]MBI3870939.1 hypothetical protein [Verrucomicrobiota bacterium]
MSFFRPFRPALKLRSRRARLLAALFVAHCAVPGNPAAQGATSAPPTLEPAKQTEKDWEDGRWQKTDVGPFLESILPAPNGTIAKGLSIRVGDRGQATVGYDTAAPNLRVAWTGGFLRFATARFGIIGEPSPAGPILFTSARSNAWGGARAEYRGLTLHSNRVAVSYAVDGTAISEMPWIEDRGDWLVVVRNFELAPHSTPLRLEVLELKGASSAQERSEGSLLEATLSTDSVLAWAGALGPALLSPEADKRGRVILTFPPSAKIERIKVLLWSGPPARSTELSALLRSTAPPESLARWTEPGAVLWPAIATQGSNGAGNQPYVVDTLTVPYDNPWRALMFTSGVDFLPNGDAAVCTLHGDVWVVGGIAEKLGQLTWRRFATGLFQPLGLRVRNGEIYVLGRDQITRLRDRDGNGEADAYDNFSNLIHTSLGGHDYVTSLELDAAGNFYFVDPIGAHRIAGDGRSIKTLATGWRNPNGMSVGPDGTITVSPQQGNWTPSSQISQVKEGAYYGFGGPHATPDQPLGYEPPLCWIPHSVDNSTGSQVWSPMDPKRWGPLSGQLLSLSFGRCALYLVYRDSVDGHPQGGVLPLKARFISGSMRGSFRSEDGQLYVVGSQGWQTAGPRDGCLQRVRYAGGKFYDPIGLSSHQDGVHLKFAEPLDPSIAEDPGSYAVEQWNYRYTSSYGSKDYSVKDPSQEGHDAMRIVSAKLSEDRRSVVLALPEIQPVMQMKISYNLTGADGHAFRGDLYHTINGLHRP